MLGIKILFCDLFCVDCGDEGDFCLLDELVQCVDILIFYMLFFKDGLYKMLYLVDEKLICSLKFGVILINVCCGVVVDNIVLLICLNEG